MTLTAIKKRNAGGLNAPHVLHATGRRKTAVARVWIKPGSGIVTINKRTLDNYFNITSFKECAIEPLLALKLNDSYDVIATVRGGGVHGQAGALRHAVARALATSPNANNETIVDNTHKILMVDTSSSETELRMISAKQKLRNIGALTRDSRMVESKKYGRKKARKRFQFSKR